MREILFRGFHPCGGPDTIVVDGEKIKGKWVYGTVARLRGLDNCLHTDIIPEIDGENIMSETVNVLPSTVGQYTGLKDKHGKRIFEGDIVTTDLQRSYLIVEFRDASFMFNCNDGDKDYYDIFLPITDTAHTEYRYGAAVGTVFDEGAGD